jgi:hypothetical protein
MLANATAPMTTPVRTNATAFQVAGWIGDSRNARTGSRTGWAAGPSRREEKGIPDEAIEASPGSRAEKRPVRTSSSPRMRIEAAIPALR